MTLQKLAAHVGDFVVQDIANIGELVEQANIKVAMLTVPVTSAQGVAETLVPAGVRAILNYAPTPLKPSGHICVQYIDPIVALQHMTYYLD